MRDHSTYDYAVIRVVPRVERGEFVNVGVLVSCPSHDFLEARIEFDPQRVAMLDPTLDLEALRAQLAAIRVICKGGEAAGAIGKLSQRERFRWLVAPRSTVIQMSPAHSGRCDDPESLIARLLDTMVRSPRAPETR